jgi:hypothetical protein
MSPTKYRGKFIYIGMMLFIYSGKNKICIPWLHDIDYWYAAIHLHKACMHADWESNDKHEDIAKKHIVFYFRKYGIWKRKHINKKALQIYNP